MKNSIKKGKLTNIINIKNVQGMFNWYVATLECGHKVSVSSISQKRTRCHHCLETEPKK